MREFEGRVAVVTGAASGIGFALATRLGQEGMKVVLADVEEEALTAAVRVLRQQEMPASLLSRRLRPVSFAIGLTAAATDASIRSCIESC